jgi:hypothetical protein
MALQERTIRRLLVDIAFDEFDPLRIQKTSGVAAGRSRGLPVEDWFGHPSILRGRTRGVLAIRGFT